MTTDPQQLSRQIGDRIRTRRVAAGLPVDEVARQVGVARETVFSWEAGNGQHGPKIGRLIQVAEVLGVPWLELVVGEDA